MVNNSIIEKDTGWRSPSRVDQYAKYGKVNQYSCYAYADLFDIKKRDKHYAYIPNTGGVNSTHRSPLVYCSGYNFNIPSNATITKILIRQRRCMNTYSYNKTYIKDYLITLKTGASTSDLGIASKGIGGHNLSEGAKWNYKTKGWGDYTVGDKYKNKEGTVQEVWGVNVTPATANNQNFGCVVQCEGTGSTWHCPKIDSIEMKITYTQVNDSSKAPSTTSNNVKNSEKEQSKQIESKIVKEYQPDESEILQTTAESIGEEYLYTPFTLWIRYRNYVDSDEDILLNGYNGAITITLNSNIRFENGQRTKTIPAFEFKQNTDEDDISRGYKTIYKELLVYPVKAGTGVISVKGVHYDDNGTTQTTQSVEVTVTESLISLSNSMCELNKVTFTNCDATKGSAICNLGALTGKYLNFNDITSTDKCFFDFDKYRDSEYR